MNDILNNLYDYQVEAVETTNKNDTGIISIFTGGGKTMIASSIIATDIINNKNQYKLYVVNLPRILLSFQLLKDVYTFLNKNNIESRYMFVHSGGKVNEKEMEEIRLNAENPLPYSDIESTIKVEVIQQMMNKAKSQNLPLIIFSTYNSADKIEIARVKTNSEISIIVNDEAHYLVQEQFHDILHILKSKRNYFFTATMSFTPSDKGRGMNNKELYGELLYKKTPLDAILMGKMVRPRLHIVTTDGVYNTDDYNKSLNKIIYNSFIQHQDVLIKTNQSPKLLITTKGTQDIRGFINPQNPSKYYKKLREDNVNIYVISSVNEIGARINNIPVNRTDFLKQLKSDGENPYTKMIVLHYDILAEGIDVSGFTGIMPLRTLSKSKFLQTYGRCARLDKIDRINIDNGAINVDDLSHFRKPYSYVIIPNIIHSNEDDKQNMIALISELRSFGFNPSEDIISSSIVHGIPKHDELNGLNDVIRRIPNMGQLIENLNADIEAENIAKLDKESLMYHFLNDII